MNIQPTIQSGITSQNNQHHQTEQIPPTQIPQSELPLGCQAGFVVNIPDDIQQHAPECGETTALLSLIKDKGLLSGLDEYIAPHWICPYISRHLLSLNPLLACCRRYSRGER